MRLMKSRHLQNGVPLSLSPPTRKDFESTSTALMRYRYPTCRALGPRGGLPY